MLVGHPTRRGIITVNLSPLKPVGEMKQQLAANEALPIDEFRQNPYTVLCTTSAGGHLAWFESGGERWFVKPVSRAREKNQPPGWSALGERGREWG